MTEALWFCLGVTIFLTGFVTLVFWQTLSTVRTAHQQQVESLKSDQRALHSLLKEANNRIQAKSLTDFLTLQAHNGGTEIVDQMPGGAVLSRNDAVEAEIAANRMGGIE